MLNKEGMGMSVKIVNYIKADGRYIRQEEIPKEKISEIIEKLTDSYLSEMDDKRKTYMEQK